MPRRTVDYCIDIMEQLKLKGITKETDIQTLRDIIEIRCGALPTTVHRYIHFLQRFGFVTKIGNGIFTINYDKVDEMLL